MGNCDQRPPQETEIGEQSEHWSDPKTLRSIS
jgi:hypothetical protein